MARVGNIDRDAEAVRTYPSPQGWLDRYSWRIDRARVEALADRAQTTVAYLCGSVENEAEVWDLFEHVICLVIDDETLVRRLAARTTNAFGKHPEELRAALGWNRTVEATTADSEPPSSTPLDQSRSSSTTSSPRNRRDARMTTPHPQADPTTGSKPSNQTPRPRSRRFG